ncbi:OsmC family protein [Thermoflexus sp.]|uniref:OsmC family protein n=1 Tax=Thermoflexus sp. TaxID=1969742 RepID=UPI0025CF240C|nr:OsmC family protein [Thermoflexus sp.]MDW8179840.1 OsmC family protein [Anaerolineae bacterium]MCS6963447.1 OsmC family protein [Thermoflexus sp.]MCS7350389.1 OsmC family protein [Thermoflexus sp.]MCX7689935.1 OsmC family protein [Thermoflexus sp.]MDW8184178.1 OsmC family protein [Anaerolineae bacterium]
MSTEIRLSLLDPQGMKLEAFTPSGHSVIMDAAPEAGGRNEGPRPMEMLLVALAGCTAMDVLSILRKKRQPLEGFSMEVRGERASEHPKVYTDIDVLYVVKGNVDPQALVRAIELSVTKYCSVSAMLRKTARIRYRYRVEPTTPGAEPVEGEYGLEEAPASA